MSLFGELLGLAFLIFIFLSPFILTGSNWTILFNKEYRKFMKEESKKKPIIIEQEKIIKICTQYQPFQLNEKKFTICNFDCDGDCQFKGTKYYIEK